MSSTYFNDRNEPEEFDRHLYIPDPNDLIVCDVCGHSYDASVLGEAVEHMHDPDLPLHPILYLVRGKRKRGYDGTPLGASDKATFHDMLIQFMIGLARKYECDDTNTPTVNIILDDEQAVPITIMKVEDNDYLIRFATDQKEAGVFTIRNQEWYYSGPLSKTEQSQVFQYVRNLRSEGD